MRGEHWLWGSPHLLGKARGKTLDIEVEGASTSLLIFFYSLFGRQNVKELLKHLFPEPNVTSLNCLFCQQVQTPTRVSLQFYQINEFSKLLWLRFWSQRMTIRLEWDSVKHKHPPRTSSCLKLHQISRTHRYQSPKCAWFKKKKIKIHENYFF